MKYTKQAVDKAIELILPIYPKCVEAFTLETPEALKMTAIEIFMISETNEYKMNYSKRVASEIIREGIKELNEKGYITYGHCENIFN